MTSWQTRVRFGVAAFAILFGGFVYQSIRERQVVAPPAPVERVDPKAVLEATSASGQSERGDEREFDLTFERLLTYEDGSSRYFTPTITVRRPGGRTVTITADEAFSGPNQVQLELSGKVELSTSDGFSLQADNGTFDRNDSVARVPGRLTFRKGRMSGSGTGGTYDERNDVLRLDSTAHVLTTDAAGRTTLDGQSGMATLDRRGDVLFLESNVHVLRGTEVIEAGSAMARMTDEESIITRLELRNRASVRGGGGPIDSMTAQAIDLDYTDDGTAIERVLMNGQASAVLAADEDVRARRLDGDSIDLLLAADGTITTLTGRGRVRLDLPGEDAAAARSISADALDGIGEQGRGLREVRFRGTVEYRERGARARPAREVRAQTLALVLDGNGVRDTQFGGGVTFDEERLRAAAPQARYRPELGVLNLFGGDSPASSVTDERISIDALTIDVALQDRDMTARGNVRTTLSGPAGAASPRDEKTPARLPGLLQQDAPASINAESLDYSGTGARAVYAGGATLVQNETAIRADTLTLDQRRGDLEATGSARSTLALDGDRFEGRANVIRYNDAERRVTYSMAPVAPTTGRGAGAAPAGTAPTLGPLAQLAGPDGDLRGERIDIVLAREGNEVERLEAHTRVTVTLGARTAVGQHLTYHAREGRYVLTGDGVTAVTIRETSQADRTCRETTGRTLTFFKSTDRIIVDGNRTRRTETRPCALPLAR